MQVDNEPVPGRQLRSKRPRGDAFSEHSNSDNEDSDSGSQDADSDQWDCNYRRIDTNMYEVKSASSLLVRCRYRYLRSFIKERMPGD
jgi:hypothetical protein